MSLLQSQYFRFLVVGLIFAVTSCQDNENSLPPIAPGPTPPEEITENILILVSLDGFRYDYPSYTDTPTLDKIASDGIKAEGLIPAFPSKTFPNHYTQVTGLYPDNHGIISNTMIDPVFNERFSLSNGATKEGKWYEGEPIWVTAENQMKTTATYFWPGSDAEIAGVRPTIYRNFDGSIPFRERTDEVLDWLALPNASRPTFITLYFQATDPDGHEHGPNPAAMESAIRNIDLELKRLVDGIVNLEMTDYINLLVVSDHGMSQLSRDSVIFLDDYIDMNDVEVVNFSPIGDLMATNGDIDAIYNSLVNVHSKMSVYKKGEVPEELHYNYHRRIQPLLLIAEDGWSITTHSFFDDHPDSFTGGAHGYDPLNKSMWGLFYATGPDIKNGLEIPAFESIHLYEMMCDLLNINPSPNDGKASVLAGILE